MATKMDRFFTRAKHSPFSVSGGYLIVVIEVVWWVVNAIDRFAYGKHKNV